VTVAIAIKTMGGSVIATDRQQTEGELKVNWGKMAVNWRAERGSLVVSGAGNAAYLDVVSDCLRDWFNDDPAVPLTATGLEPGLQKRHEDFYQRYVMPFEGYQEYERPDYELLIVGSPVNSEARIWTTHKLVMQRHHEDFAAVGCGGTVARALLDKFHIPGLPLDAAINLAALVLWEVKQSVDGVGLETDLMEIRRDHLPKMIPREQVNLMEAQFRSYRKLEAGTLYYCLGGDLTDAQKQMWEQFEDDDETRKKSIRQFFEKLNDERAKPK